MKMILSEKDFFDNEFIEQIDFIGLRSKELPSWTCFQFCFPASISFGKKPGHGAWG